MSLKRHIPNCITCCNLLSGCLSVLFLASGMPVKASVMVVAAAVFDFLDGLAARLLKAHSPIGADLDSLSDVVSFGVAPGFIMYWLIARALPEPVLPVGGFDLVPCSAFMLTVFCAVRLARFNVDDTQATSFRGIPAPGMAFFVASLPLALSQTGHLTDGTLRAGYCLGFVVLFSLMMVCNLRFFSFKVKDLKWKGNEVRFVFVALAVAAFAAFRLVALPFIVMGYVLLSVTSPSSGR